MAGIHCLLADTDSLVAADAVVVVAGMEGALASVVGGLTAAPVIAVPTSAGYGAAFSGGVTALLAMLSSCAGRGCGRHRQRLRRGLRRPASAASARRPRGQPAEWRCAWFHCFSGIAGDMALGVAASTRGRDARRGRAVVAGACRCRGLGAAGRSRAAGRHRRHARPVVDVDDARPPCAPPRRHRAACSTGAAAARPGRRPSPRHVPPRWPRRRAASTAVPPDQVHFHEVGALDAIVDVVGTCAALELLDVDEVRTSPVTVGLGTVPAAHGELPNPAPASLVLLAAAGIPVTGVASPIELATPTGAALWPVWSRAADRSTDDPSRSATARAGGTWRAGPTSSRW